MNPTLHIAGPLGPDKIQRCARCFKPLKDFRPGTRIEPVAMSGGIVYQEGDEIEAGAVRGVIPYQAMSLKPNPEARACTNGSVVDELTYRSYRENRRLSPHVNPERWIAVYSNALNLETRYQDEQAGDLLMVEAFGEVWG